MIRELELQNKDEEIYDIDSQEGVIVNKRFGLRSFILGARQWNSIVESLSSKFSSGAEVILFQSGKTYGSSVLEAEREVDPDRDFTIGVLSHEAMIAGWGKVTVTSKSQKQYTIGVLRCVFCSATKDPARKQIGCFFLKGVISGFAEALFTSHADVQETHCGKDFCEFSVSMDR